MSFKDTLRKVIKDSLTGIDGVTYDGAKVVGYPAWILAILVYIGSALKDVGFHASAALDYQGFATGISILCGGLMLIAAGVAVKHMTEPKPLDTTTLSTTETTQTNNVQ